jgi:quercetin dioxygenase-like cupin family protein
MKIMMAGNNQSKKANSEWFTGDVWQDTIIEAPEPARLRALRVTFTPGSRTAWHTHPLGQTLHVIEGFGLIGVRTGEVNVIKPGDTVWIPPNEEHWHGATASNVMVHLALQESLEGKTANWLEHVSDSDYQL